MPRKTFANGFPLPASDLNTYLMDQSVQTYADATARTAALATPVEGQMSYLADTNTAYVYDGSSWNAVVDAKNYGSVLPNGAAGRNKVINGAFDNWQRGSTISLLNGAPVYTADRWYVYSGFSAGTSSFSQQTFTPGTAPVAGYESATFGRLTCGSTASYIQIEEKIEDVRTFAGQTATLSFWAKSSAAITLQSFFAQSFGSGGSSQVTTYGAAPVLTSSWVRYTTTVAIPSISGKTIGTGNYLSVAFGSGASLNGATVDIWGVQLEAGSFATPFARNGGTQQAEVAACQRYYVRFQSGGNYAIIGNGYTTSTTNADINISLPVPMRVTPTSVDYSTLLIQDSASGGYTITGVTLGAAYSSPYNANVGCGIAGATAGRYARILNNNNVNGYIGFSAEL